MICENVIQKKAYCVYGLLCPNTLSIKYIGLTKNIKNRIINHYANGSPAYLKSFDKKKDKLYLWIAKLKLNKLQPIPIILKEFTDKDRGAKHELRLIKKHKSILLNSEHGFKNSKP